MGTYWMAACHEEKVYIKPPGNFAIKFPGIIHPENPFSHMVMLAQFKFHKPFELISDSGDDMYKAEQNYSDITNEIYAEYMLMFPLEIHEKR